MWNMNREYGDPSPTVGWNSVLNQYDVDVAARLDSGLLQGVALLASSL